MNETSLGTVQNAEHFYIVMPMTSAHLAPFTAAWRQLTRNETFKLCFYESKSDAEKGSRRNENPANYQRGDGEYESVVDSGDIAIFDQ